MAAPVETLDIDEAIDLSFAGPPISPTATRRSRWVEKTSAYLPFLLMALLGGVMWWLVRSAGLVEAPRAEVAPKHEPDYTMTAFLIQRFGPNGALRTQIEGDTLRHYPDDDTLEIDNARIRAVGATGVVTLASAARALASGDGSEVKLFDNAHVVRPATAAGPQLEFRSDFLHALRNVERVRSNLPVTVTQGAAVFRASGMDYDNLARTLDFTGPTHAVFDAKTASSRKPSP